MHLPDLFQITVGDDVSGRIGHDEIGYVRCLRCFGEETLNTKSSSPHPHHSCPCAGFYGSDQYKELSEMTGYEMSLPMNSGAEAVETAVKLARKWAYRVKGVPRHEAEIIIADGNFHGRTVTIISFSTEPLYRDDFGPFTPGFVVVKYGDADAIEKAITPNTAAVMLEPIQGEAGVIIPPAGYLKKVVEICRKNNVLFIADEIQTGLGRDGETVRVAL